jgi:hypothetical protein
MNVEIGTEAAQFPEKEYINVIFVAVQLCSSTVLTLDPVQQSRDFDPLFVAHQENMKRGFDHVLYIEHIFSSSSAAYKICN